jgi:hypothetical protein
MEYVFETKLKGDERGVLYINGSDTGFPVQLKASIGFDTDYPPDPDYPTLIFIHTCGVKYRRNKVSLNGNFIGYLNAASNVTILEVDNSLRGGLRQQGNKINITSCDFWGNSDPQSWPKLDNFEINVVQVAYSREGVKPRDCMIDCPLY